nr:hypothetical protein [Sphingomonas bacterium]
MISRIRVDGVVLGRSRSFINIMAKACTRGIFVGFLLIVTSTSPPSSRANACSKDAGGVGLGFIGRPSGFADGIPSLN